MKEILPDQLKAQTLLLGRWTTKQLHGKRVLYTTNLGSLIKFHLQNSPFLEIEVLDNGNPQMPPQYWAVRVNHGNWQRWSTRDAFFELQVPNNAEIEIITAGNTDLDDVWLGNQGLAIASVTIADQAVITPPKSQKRVTVIGDSITAGCWVNGKRPSSDYRPESCYIGLVSDALRIDVERIAYSAGGVLRSAVGNVPPAAQFLSRLDAQTPWQPSIMPELVLINLGVNDRHFASQQFQKAYLAFVKQVQSTYPNVPLALMVPFAQTYADIIEETALECHTKFIPTKNWCQSFTDGLHPDLKGSLQIAQHLTPVLATLLNKNQQ
ncbi:SGNH/GDSL hydrolase family protein [Limosilactobacillus mucosae]|uniref:SGNH/GDSL hydrolase family protein n=1 Tax=Limosilactobacillus mucosae TaxID=97478 RepID=UPI003995CCD1